MSLFDTLIVCHLIGDFLIQNHWMQRKSKDSFVCSVHVAAYSIPFILCNVPWLLLAVILTEHWIQDRFALHIKWMKAIRQTPPEQWPTGPLFVDQAWHVTFMALFCTFIPA